MAKMPAEILLDEFLNDSSAYEPFFAKKCTLPQFSRRGKAGIKPDSAKIDEADTIEEGIVYSNSASESSDCSNSDTDGLWIDLDPPANYKKRPSVNCFTKPLAQASVADIQLQTTTPTKLKVKHKASQTELKIKIIGAKKLKSKDRGCQTDIDYVVVDPQPSTAVNVQPSLDKKSRTYWNRNKKRSSSNTTQNERSSSHPSHKKKKKKRRRPTISERDCDSDMDPPTRGGEV